MKFYLTEIDRLVLAHRAEDPMGNSESLLRLLKKWWCMKYNRPLKDPLLESYLPEELVYEFLFFYYQDPENDPEIKKEKELLEQNEKDWIKKQLESYAKKNDAACQDSNINKEISKIPEDKKQEIIEEAKEVERLEEVGKSIMDMPVLPEIHTTF